MSEFRQEHEDITARRHETRDADTGPVAWTFGGLLALLFCALLIGWGLLRLLLAAAPQTPPAVPPRAVAPVEPALQVSPSKDLGTLRAEEERILHGTQWVDRQAGIARIPIEQAMTLLVKRSKSAGGTKP